MKEWYNTKPKAPPMPPPPDPMVFDDGFDLSERLMLGCFTLVALGAVVFIIVWAISQGLFQ